MYFRKEHRIGADDCWKDAELEQSKNIHDYMLFNIYKTNVPDCQDELQRLSDFVVENNMHIREGYGNTNSCLIDKDSEVRNNQKITNEKCKSQLDSRVFHAVPDLSHGGFKAELESKLTQGEDTGEKKSCNVLSGKGLDVFTPLIPCIKNTVQDPNNLVPTWTWGGEHTRDHLQQKKFLEQNGYVFDGKVWKKKFCNPNGK